MLKLKSLAIEGFKCFGLRNEIEFAPITIFVGPNNSGKSAVIQSLLLFKQTIEAKSNEPAIQIAGPYFDFGTYQDMVYGNNLNRNIKLDVAIENSDKKGKVDSHEWKIEFASRKKGTKVFVRRFINIVNGKKIIDAHSDGEGNFSQVTLLLQKYNNLISSEQTKIIKGKKKVDKFFQRSNFALIPQYPFAILELFGLKFPGNVKKQEKQKYGELLNKIHDDFFPGCFISFFRRSSYIGPLRDYPQRLYAYTGEQSSQVGSRGEGTPGILVSRMDKRAKKSKMFWGKLKKWFINAGLATGLKVDPLTTRHYEIKVLGMGSRKYQNISDVGFGNSQALPLAVEVFLGRRNMLHIIEQPEIHLHPKAQCEIGALLLDGLKFQKQFIVETHSLDLIIRLRRYIAKGAIKPSDVKVYFVNQEKGISKLEKLQLKKDFSFENWPKGFFEERYKETIQIMNRK